ncbi:MAG: aminotransferase class V-fold PLP-dependent enzyme [Clostridium argentinense]|uniref:aminotransferase class V-fold PLP-dependent enzyme n=1 Tax=Clostridium butanoliproducens TaxID=2991837 RepID=UPI001D7F9E8A|nr:aminotransferase class V-fold PLP-dependent enzyme [Clostridium butanoliproducens]MBS5823500.1 aminotransferase class V-fold PLP-dependent enzyme [Clostridium argentinense]
MKTFYMDNAATSFPKAPGVAESMSNYILNIGCNINRGVYSKSLEAENIAFETRELLCSIFNFDKPENVIFTSNVTTSLNMLMKGLLRRGDHVIVSSLEHNAVMRPLTSLHNIGVEFSRCPCDSEGNLSVDKLISLVKPNTKAVIMTHASNVCGTILPLKTVGEICKKHNLFFIIDGAQSAGFLDIDFYDLNASAIAFTGHKGLLGPQGIGGFLINSKLAHNVSPIIEGGTGSLSELETQPEYMPDKFESGTPNIPGIYGLNASLKYILKEGISSIREKELEITDKFLNEIHNLNEVKIIGIKEIKNRTAVVSLDFLNRDNGIVSYYLNKNYGISTRSGLHCAPSAHKSLGTFPNGTVRFSFSHFTTIEDINYSINAINKVIENVDKY